jgi:hypothetical protein
MYLLTKQLSRKYPASRVATHREGRDPRTDPFGTSFANVRNRLHARFTAFMHFLFLF